MSGMNTCARAFWSEAIAVGCGMLLAACGSSTGSGGTGGSQAGGSGVPEVAE
jgi:hypothetical protein